MPLWFAMLINPTMTAFGQHLMEKLTGNILSKSGLNKVKKTKFHQFESKNPAMVAQFAKKSVSFSIWAFSVRMVDRIPLKYGVLIVQGGNPLSQFPLQNAGQLTVYNTCLQCQLLKILISQAQKFRTQCLSQNDQAYLEEVIIPGLKPSK